MTAKSRVLAVSGGMAALALTVGCSSTGDTPETTTPTTSDIGTTTAAAPGAAAAASREWAA